MLYKKNKNNEIHATKRRLSNCLRVLSPTLQTAILIQSCRLIVACIEGSSTMWRNPAASWQCHKRPILDAADINQVEASGWKHQPSRTMGEKWKGMSASELQHLPLSTGYLDWWGKHSQKAEIKRGRAKANWKMYEILWSQCSGAISVIATRFFARPLMLSQPRGKFKLNKCKIQLAPILYLDS